MKPIPNNNNNQYVNQIKQQIQQAEANKNQASGRFATLNAMNSMNEEFGTETDVNQVKQQIQQAEAKKIQASGRNGNNGYGNNTN
ncbi:small acid-soluble spore protein E (minor gamma-type SASP) [Lysinibacillus parviboronicapiens]|uniref:Small, acid-soluble spore protein gamma-type n=1 Tax=Lysinibacillus parviboronicapiens TaxID=436516 RepID=A0ABV2PP97_9BACI